MEPQQKTRERLEERLTYLIQRMHKVEGDRRRKRNPQLRQPKPPFRTRSYHVQRDKVPHPLTLCLFERGRMGFALYIHFQETR